MKNKKGFTLVELLAVIVILALIMSIAIVSIGGILNSARKSTLKETAVSIINGVRQQIIVANKLEQGDYEFSKALLEKGADKSPLGGDYKFSDLSSCASGKKIGDVVCQINTTATATCGKSSNSFVRVTQSGTTYKYSICLMTDGASNKYIDVANGTEEKLLDSSNESMIITPSS